MNGNPSFATAEMWTLLTIGQILLVLAGQVEVGEATAPTGPKMLAFEHALLQLSDAVAARYFLQGANAVPTVQLAGLA